MEIRIRILLIVFIFSSKVHATIWHVGPQDTYKLPSQVSALVKDFDTVFIQAGDYVQDVTVWKAHNIYIHGVDGLAHMQSQGKAYGGKAIWVIQGNNYVIDHIAFSGCKVPDKNGAGIRQEGTSLTISYCTFFDNEEGILAGDNANSVILIDHCEFRNNGAGDGYSHNIYINHIKKLVITCSYFHRAVIGHEIKSRAHETQILYNLIANEDGNASREIDVPNGGKVIIAGNSIQQGVHGENSNIIGYGLEGISNPEPNALFVINNTIINHKGAGSFIQFPSMTKTATIWNNLIIGKGSFIAGNTSSLDTQKNFFLQDTMQEHFVEPKVNDYRPTAFTPGKDIGKIHPEITLISEYQHPSDCKSREMDGSIDLGAYEFDKTSATYFPNASEQNYISWEELNEDAFSKAYLINIDGMIFQVQNHYALPAGFYFIFLPRSPRRLWYFTIKYK